MGVPDADDLEAPRARLVLRAHEAARIELVALASPFGVQVPREERELDAQAGSVARADENAASLARVFGARPAGELAPLPSRKAQRGRASYAGGE